MVNSVQQEKLGPVLLAPGIRRKHAIYFLFGHGILICLNNFIGIIQPFLMTEVMHLPRAQQGMLTGGLASTQQVAMMVLLLVIGILSDRVGRRIFMVAAAVIMTTVLIIYPLAGGIVGLFLLRFIFGVGWATQAAVEAALRADLPDNNSRGRWSTIAIVFNTTLLAVFVSFLGARMPAWLLDGGVSAANAARYTAWFVAILGGVAILALLGLKRDRQPAGEKLTLLRNLRESVGEVWAYARVDYHYRMSILMAPITRSDSMIMGTFLSLWIMTAARDQGLSSAEALRTVSNIALAVSVSDVIFGSAFGFLADRIDRLKMVILGLSLTAVAFLSPLWVTSVTGFTIFAAVGFVQLAESCTSVGSSAYKGEVTPPHLRGATFSISSWIGQIAVFFIAILGGWLFDNVGHGAPFALISGLAVLWLLIAAVAHAWPGARPRAGTRTP